MAEEKKPSSNGDIVFFLGLLLIFFLVWIAGGGPSRSISFSGPYLTPITGPNFTPQGYGSALYPGAGTTKSSLAFVRDSSGAKSDNASSEYVTITLSPAASESVSLAGWRIASKQTGKGAVFPLGTEVATSGKVNALVPVVLAPGEQAIVVSGRSPVGVSFRENMCTGYFEERQNFKPSLAQGCPTPFQELQRFYPNHSNECEAYVRSISYCSTDTNAKSVGGSCEAFVDEHLNYNGCVAAHKHDAGFTDSTWRLFLGSSDELWKDERETLELIDPQGTVVDSLSF